MSLLGIDVGTTGCKATVFSEEGDLIASGYEEYDVQRPQSGWAELDAPAVWEKVKGTIQRVASHTQADPIKALSVSSLGEAVVPVSQDRRILGPSILNFDERGADCVDRLGHKVDPMRLYTINGNMIGNHYSLTKLLWIRDRQPSLFERTYKFLHWGSFVPFMLGAEPMVDYSLANRTLAFDLEQRTWSDEILNAVGLDRSRLPDTVPSGTLVGTVSQEMADTLGLPSGTKIAAGAHDQCANAVGCGVIEEGRAMLGMGTYLCIVPVYRQRREPALMLERGLNTEHHALPNRYVSFIYNQGGSLVKWFRDTFAALEHWQAKEAGTDVYDNLMAEMPQHPSSVIVLPHFAPTGPPHFIADSCGVIAGLRLETTRGDILKGIIEGSLFYLRECVESLPATGIKILDFRAVGGGSKSAAWVQMCADVFGKVFVRPRLTEAGALGAAILAGTAAGTFAGAAEGAEIMVQPEREFEPEPSVQKRYDTRFEEYAELWPLMSDYLRTLVP
jgi:xylulokinase